MSAETQLNTLLSGHAPLTALVADRIYPAALPEGADYPAVTFSRTATEPITGIGGAHFGDWVDFELSAWAAASDDAGAVADAVEAALRAGGEAPGNRTAGYAEEAGLYGVALAVRLLVSN